MVVSVSAAMSVLGLLVLVGALRPVHGDMKAGACRRDRRVDPKCISTVLFPDLLGREKLVRYPEL